MSERDTIALQFDMSPVGELPLVAKVRRALPELRAPELRGDVAAIARRAWEDRTRAEYVGVMIVRRFHGLLVDLNAPMDLQELALAMMVQEQQHANLCAAAARALGSDGEVAFELPELQQARTQQELHVQLLEMIVGTYCIGERVALALLSHTVKELPDSGFRDILKVILADEVLHGRFGPPLVRHIREGTEPRFLPWPGDAWLEATVARQVASMRGRDVVEPDEAAMFEDVQARSQLMAVGIPDSAAFKAVYMDALEREVPAALREAGVEDAGAS